MKKVKYLLLCFGLIWLSIILYGAFHPAPYTAYNLSISDYAMRWNVDLPENVTQVYQYNTPIDGRDTLSYTVYSIPNETDLSSTFKNERSEEMETNFSDEIKGWKLLSKMDMTYYPDLQKDYSYLYISKYEHSEVLIAVYIKDDAKLYVLENI